VRAPLDAACALLVPAATQDPTRLACLQANVRKSSFPHAAYTPPHTPSGPDFCVLQWRGSLHPFVRAHGPAWASASSQQEGQQQQQEHTEELKRWEAAALHAAGLAGEDGALRLSCVPGYAVAVLEGVLVAQGFELSDNEPCTRQVCVLGLHGCTAWR